MDWLHYLGFSAPSPTDAENAARPVDATGNHPEVEQAQAPIARVVFRGRLALRR